MLEDTVSDIIQKTRQGKGLSIRAIADRTHVSSAEIVAMEEGRAPVLRAVAEELGLSYTKLRTIGKSRHMIERVQGEIGTMELESFEVEVGGIVSNAYILSEGFSALLVDAVGASEKALAMIRENSLNPVALLITHGHFDHTAGVESVSERFPEISIIHAGRDTVEDAILLFPPFNIQVFKTPGHTEDSVCYYVGNKIMFTGDTIFAGSVGRPNYSMDALLANIRNKIFVLPENTILAPGHGPMTTVGEEKRHNPFFL